MCCKWKEAESSNNVFYSCHYTIFLMEAHFFLFGIHFSFSCLCHYFFSMWFTAFSSDKFQMSGETHISVLVSSERLTTSPKLVSYLGVRKIQRNFHNMDAQTAPDSNYISISEGHINIFNGFPGGSYM